MADHLKNSNNAMLDLGAASHVAGRSVIGLVGVLKQGRDAMEQHIQANAGYGASMEAAAASAKKVVQLEAQLSHAWRGLAADVLPAVTIAIQAVASVLQETWALLKAVYDSVESLGWAIIHGLGGPIAAVVKLVHGDMAGAWKEMTAAGDKMAGDFIHSGQRIVDYFKQAHQQIAAVWKSPPAEAGGAEAADTAPEGGDASGHDRASKSIRGHAHALQDLVHASDAYGAAMAKLSAKQAQIDQAEEATARRFENEYTRGQEQMKKAATATVEIQIPLWQRLTPAVASALEKMQSVAAAYELLGVDSTATVVQAADGFRRRP